MTSYESLARIFSQSFTSTYLSKHVLHEEMRQARIVELKMEIIQYNL